MLILNGKNLGERQKELNLKVNEAAVRKLDFDDVKNTKEETDVDKLYKIDLASKYLNIDYIIEVLKAGDSLHISRALKCTWIFDKPYSHVINVDYLHHNVFPYMSLKMKKKLLSTAAMHIKSEERAATFYKYCKDTNFIHFALKFLIFTNEVFKADFLKENVDLIEDIECKNYLKHFFGSSFTLAEQYFSALGTDSRKVDFLNEISFLYTTSSEKYLNMLEKQLEQISYKNSTCLGLRISKDILVKHKQRVLSKPQIYIDLLNKKHVVKYSNLDNAKTYLQNLAPKYSENFWGDRFCDKYEHIVNVIPAKERFSFVKGLYNAKYPEQVFEMGVNFYNYELYKLMTAEEKETWALSQIVNPKTVQDTGNNYCFYKFVKFDIAFEEIKKLVMITTNITKRSELLDILVGCAKSQRDLESLFKYYHARHNNEQQYNKNNFINLVVQNYNVFEFDKDCWSALNMIFQNLDVYSMEVCKRRIELKIIALIYQIINSIEVHEGLKKHINKMDVYTLKQYTNKLSKEQEEMVYQFLFNFYMNEVNAFDIKAYNKDIRRQVRRPINFVMDVLANYDRTEKDIPEVVMKFIKLDWDEFYRHKLLYATPTNITQEDFIRYLKTDAKLAIEKIPLLKNGVELAYRGLFHIGKFLKKLLVYFPNDVSKEYLNFYNTLLSENPQWCIARAATYGIFLLADDDHKNRFLLKYAPTESKINRAEMDERVLNIQESICATASYSRPPVPLKNILMYIKGDYVPSCLNMFYSYLANLPLPLCMEFIEAILNKPLSIQKHGLRLAFVCFSTENLKNLIMRVWKKTKNISLRLIIYQTLYDKIENGDQNVQTELFETLKAFTLTLHQDDDKELFDILTSGGMPEHLISDYTNTIWTAVSALPNTSNVNLQRMVSVVEFVRDNIVLIRQDTIQPLVEDFIKNVFDAPESVGKESSSEANDLVTKRWALTAKYIMFVRNKDELNIKLELTKSIVRQCMSIFNLVGEGDKYIGRYLCFKFIEHLQGQAFMWDNLECFEYENVIFETILNILSETLSKQDIYIIEWEPKLSIVGTKATADVSTYLSTVEDRKDIKTRVKNTILNFGADIGNLIKEHIAENTYFTSFMPAVYKLFFKETDTISSYGEKILVLEDLYVITSLALMEFKTLEMYLFALYILPVDYDGCYVTEYKSIINEIINLDNIEVACVAFEKFVNRDFKARTPFAQSILFTK